MGMAEWSIDISAVRLEKGETLASEQRVSLKTIQADLTNWKYPDDLFDAVVSNFVHLSPEHRPGGSQIFDSMSQTERLSYYVGDSQRSAKLSFGRPTARGDAFHC
jgi:hypothetical protein